MSVTSLAIDVKIQGAEDAAAKLQKVEQAADSVGKKAGGATGLFAKFEQGVRSLDDAVDKVEKPMRTFSGALDLASIALGVGLAGPLGQVVGQLKDLVVGMYDAINVTADYETSTKKLAEAKSELAKKEKEASDAAQAGIKARQDFVQQTLATFTANVEGADDVLFERVKGLASSVKGAQLQLQDLLQRYSENAIGTVEFRKNADQLNQTIASQTSVLRSLGATTDSVAKSTDDAAKSSEKRAAAVKAEVSSLEGLKKALEAIDPLVQRAGAEARASRLARGVEAGTVSVTDGMFPTEARTAQDVLRTGAEDIAAEFDAMDKMREQAEAKKKEAATKTLTPLERELDGITQSAMNLESLGVGALQSFSQAAGQALASLVIDGDKAGVSFKKLAGQVAAGLSAQAFGYAVFLGALGVAASLTGPVLGYTAPGLFQGAAVMAGTGLLLAGTARALGASTVGSSSGAASAAGSAGGAQDRVSSFSAGGGGAQPMQVTVVLGVDEVSNVLVRQSQREARSGSLSTSRLAVA